MADFNHKDARIAKLHAKGLDVAQIARKLGAPDDIDRVLAGLRCTVPGFREEELDEIAGIYSDVYKDTYGMRPRGGSGSWTADEYHYEIDALQREQRRQEENNRIPTEGPGWKLEKS